MRQRMAANIAVRCVRNSVLEYRAAGLRTRGKERVDGKSRLILWGNQNNELARQPGSDPVGVESWLAADWPRATVCQSKRAAGALIWTGE